MHYLRILTGVFIIFCLIYITSNIVYAEDLSIHQTNLNLIERITKLEEGQKSIVTEMRTGQQAVNSRFEMMEKNIDSRFESLIREMNQRFESVDKRFESIDKRFESIDKRFDLLTDQNNKRFDSLENQYNFQGNLSLVIFAAIISLMGYIIWDRKSYIEKIEKIERLFQSDPVAIKEKEQTVPVDSNNMKSAEQLIKEGFTIPEHIQEKFRDVFTFLNQFPEMRPVLRAV